MSSCFYAYGGSSHHTRKTHWEEFLIWVYNYHPPHRQKRSQNWREFAFAICGATSSLDDQFPVAWLWHSLDEKGGSHYETGFC